MGTAQENQSGCVSGFPQGAVRLGLWSSRRCCRVSIQTLLGFTLLFRYFDYILCLLI